MLWPASPPLSLRHRLSRCAAASLSQCAVASLVAPLPLSPRQHLSHCASLAPAVDCYIVTSLAVPVPLLSCRHLSRCAATSFDAGVTHYLTLSYTINYTLIHYCTLSFFHCRRETIFWIMWKLIDFTTLNQERRKTRKLLISCLVQKNLFSFANYKKPNQERRNRREASAKASHPS